MDLVAVARDLETRSEAWDLQAVEAARRLIRESERAVWEPIARSLGRRASSEPDAQALLVALLDAPVPELQVRGLAALSTLIPTSPERLAELVEARVLETADIPDPILLQASLSLLPLLPRPRAEAIFQAALSSSSDAVRAATAATLACWHPLPAAWQPLIQDASPLTRANLASCLLSLALQPEILVGLERLARDAEPMVRALLAADMRPTHPAYNRLRRILSDDSDTLVRKAMAGHLSGSKWDGSASLEEELEDITPSLTAVQTLEAMLDALPERALEMVRPMLSRNGAAAALEICAHLARHEGVAHLCHGLHGLLDPRPQDPFTRLLLACDHLRHAPGAEAVASLVTWALQAIEVASWDGILQIEMHPLLAPVAEALTMPPSIAALSAALGRLRDAELEIAAAELPEQRVLAIVINCWQEVLEHDLQALVAGEL